MTHIIKLFKKEIRLTPYRDGQSTRYDLLPTLWVLRENGAQNFVPIWLRSHLFVTWNINDLRRKAPFALQGGKQKRYGSYAFAAGFSYGFYVLPSLRVQLPVKNSAWPFWSVSFNIFMLSVFMSKNLYSYKEVEEMEKGGEK